ncbi:MAG TPA: ATP-binding protein, partial [Leptospiraceae bacterium]|nr:ATP-binding protein [Leptospiraceae bacterium]
SPAFESACIFFKIAESLLPEDFWSLHYADALDFYSDKAHAEYLSKDFGSAESTLDLIFQNAKTVLDRIIVYELRAAIYTSWNRIKESIEFLTEALNSLGMSIPENPSELSTLYEIIVNKIRMRNKSIHSLVSLPQMQDRKSQIIMKLLNVALAPAFIAKPALFPVLVVKMVNLSLKMGLNYLSPFAFSAFAVIQGAGLGDYQKGYEYGKTAVELLKHLGKTAKPMECRTLFMFAVMVKHWKFHASHSRPLLFRAIQSGQEYGDIVYTSYAFNHINIQSLLMRNNLENLLNDLRNLKPAARRLKQHDAFLLNLLNESFAMILSGESENIFSFTNSELDEEACLAEWTQADNKTVLFSYYTFKSEIYYFCRDFENAYQYSLKADSFEFAVMGMMTVPEHVFFNSLIIYELIKNRSSNAQKNHLKKKLKKNLKKMKVWGENCPENYSHKYYIMMGLFLEISGKESEAFPFYEKAVKSADSNDYFLESYLGNRLIAEQWHRRGNERYAEIHLKDALFACKKWGCGLIIALMEKEFPFLKKELSDSGRTAAVPGSLSSSSSNTSFLDLDTVIKASQAVSGEIQLSRLLEKMMKLIFENAGAERGTFILKQDDVWKVYAKAESGKGAYVLEGTDLNSENDPALEHMALNIVHYVTRSGNQILLNDASKSIFVNDEYIIKNNIKSVLCYPVHSQGKLIGTVYLENSLTSDAFTPERVELLKMLSAQTAVSLENSILYSSMEKKVEERTRSLEYANAELEKLAQSRLRLSAIGEMVSGLVHDIKNPIGTVKAFAEMIKNPETDSETRSEYADLILRETDRLGDIAYEILDFSKGKISLNLENHRVDGFLDELYQFLKIDFEYAGISFDVECNYEGELSFDRDRLRRVIVNLANNSREAMSAWKGERHFSISAEKMKDSAIFRVEDTGPGIPESIADRLFEAFATEGKQKGTGLGLYMSRMIAEQHKGSLTYSPYEGSGAVFIIKIPIQDQEKKL